MPDHELYLSADEAAEALGISLSTLYAYVGRKGIRSQRVEGARQRRYWKADIEQLQGRKAGEIPRVVEAPPTSEITLITERGPFYRGRSAVELSESFTVEEVACLLWGMQPGEIRDTAPTQPPKVKAIQKLLADDRAVDRATALFPFLEAADPRAYDLSPAGMRRTGMDVLRWYAAILLKQDTPSSLPIHETIARVLKLSPEMSDLVRRLLILAADHGFETNAAAVRGVASTGVTPWRSVLTGLSITTGRRSRFGRMEGLLRLLDEIDAQADPTEPILRRLREGDALPGFGFALYPQGDPRARALLSRLAEIRVGDPGLAKLQTAIDMVREVKGLEPDFALATLYVGRLVGLDNRDSLFTLGRAVGWIAHSIEQYQEGESARRPSLYVGPLPQ
jgi:citrate synthase